MTPAEIRQRITSCDRNELAANADHAATLASIRTAREYVQRECGHENTKKVYQISHYETVCCDCGAKL